MTDMQNSEAPHVVSYDGLWSVTITEAQYQAGLAAKRAEGSTHWRIWKALKDAGVPVCDDRGQTIASNAATAIACEGTKPVTLESAGLA